MDLKIVSGVLVTKDHVEGKAVIDLARNEIVDGVLAASDLQKEKTIAPAGMKRSYFDEVPCSTIALREIEIQTIDRDDFGSRPPISEFDRLRINTSINAQRLTIDWKATAGSKIEEISFLAIGPVSLPPAGPH